MTYILEMYSWQQKISQLEIIENMKILKSNKICKLKKLEVVLQQNETTWAMEHNGRTISIVNRQ